MEPSTAADPPIVAIATPEGPGAVAMIRVSGKGSWELLEPLLAPSASIVPRAPRTLEIDWSEGAPPLPGVGVWFEARSSYTGEQSAELYLPSAPALLRACLDHFTQHGFRTAEPGEFTRRAFLNGRLDLTQAEAVAQVIAADDLSRATAVRRTLEGRLGRATEEIGETIHNLVALLEAGLDFSEQEVEPPDSEWLAGQVDGIARALRDLGAAPEGRVREQSRVRFLIAGRANAGKSTLFNQLSGAEIAITSPAAGTTRDPVSTVIRRPDLIPFELVDLAGEREAEHAAEIAAQERGRAWLAEGDTILYVVDASRPREELVAEWASRSTTDLERTWLILNKVDLLAVSSWQDLREAMSGTPSLRPARVLPSSALRGTEIEPIQSAIAEHLTRGSWTSRGEGYVFTDRQVRALGKCRQLVVRLRDELLEGAMGGPEIVVVELRDAHALLEELTGALSTEDTLDRIFSQFCLGK